MTDLTVHIVDDDPSVLESLSIMLSSSGFNTRCYSSARAFLGTYSASGRDCLLLDVNMPGMTGLELQQCLNEAHIKIPTIVITAHGSVATAVKAMKNGAVDFIEKPYRENEIIEKIRSLPQHQEQAESSPAAISRFHELFAGLTPREQEVFREMVKGQSSKAIAKTLGVSFRTIEIHRAHVLQKMQVSNLPELIRKSILAGI